jgi:hypothetical protein
MATGAAATVIAAAKPPGRNGDSPGMRPTQSLPISQFCHHAAVRLQGMPWK